MASNNPYSRGYAAIWAAFNQWPQLVAIVRPGTGTQVNAQLQSYQPSPLNVSQPGDRAQLKLFERRLVLNPLKRNSTTAFLSAVYTLEINSGAYTVDLANLLSIECVRAIIAIDQNYKIGIGDILMDWEPIDGIVKPVDPQGRRPEWCAVFALRLNYSMTLADFMAADFT